jgi:prepilin-type N-terminal cleavage/methylation domain-containing protein
LTASWSRFPEMERKVDGRPLTPVFPPVAPRSEWHADCIFSGIMNRLLLLADNDGIRCLETPPPLRTDADRGFSLIEVLFAAGLISFLLAGTAELLLSSIEVDRKSDRTVSLAGLLSSEIDEFKAKPFDAPELAPGSGEIVLRADPVSAPVTVEWTIVEISSTLKKVKFTLTREGRNDRPLEAVLLITRELAVR